MSILNPIQQGNEPSLAEKQVRAATRALNLASQTYRQLCITQKQGIDIVWNNAAGLTPQQVCDGLGTNAVKVFDFHGELTEVIVAIANIDGVQPDISLPTNNFVRNEDGTVTILDTPYGS